MVKEIYRFLRWKMPTVATKLLIRYHHGSATEKHRTDTETTLMNGECRIAVATDALGMGANMQDIELVVQVKVGESLSATVQRLGRAGRNGVYQARGIVLVEKSALKDPDPTARRTGKAKSRTERGDSYREFLKQTDSQCISAMVEKGMEGPASNLDVPPMDTSALYHGPWRCCSFCDSQTGDVATAVNPSILVPGQNGDDGAAGETGGDGASDAEGAEANGLNKRLSKKRMDNILKQQLTDMVHREVSVMWKAGIGKSSRLLAGREGIVELRKVGKVVELIRKLGDCMDELELTKRLTMVPRPEVRKHLITAAKAVLSDWDTPWEAEKAGRVAETKRTRTNIANERVRLQVLEPNFRCQRIWSLDRQRREWQ